MKRINVLLSCISVFLIPFYIFRFTILGMPTNIFEIFVFLSFLIVFFTNLFDLSLKKINWGSVWPYLLIIFALISTILSEDKLHAFGIVKSWFVVPIMLYLTIINTFDRKNIYKLAWPIFVSLVFVSIWAVFQKLGLITTLFYQKGDPGFSEYLSGNIRAFGPFESPNYLAMYLVPVSFLSSIIFKNIKEWWQKIAFSAFYILPLLALWFSGSRAGIISLLSGFLIFIAIYYGDRVKIDKKYSIAIVGLLIVLTISASIYLSPREGSDAIRKEIYSYSIQMIRENWFGGIGLGNFQRTIASMSVDNASFQKYGLSYALHPHNLFLSYWLNLGLLGFLTFLTIIYQFIVNLIKSYKSNPFITAVMASAMSAILIHGLFDTTYFKNDLSAIFWLIFACSIIIRSSNNEVA